MISQAREKTEINSDHIKPKETLTSLASAVADDDAADDNNVDEDKRGVLT